MKTTRRSSLTILALLGLILAALWLVAGSQVGVHAADLTVCPSGPPACHYAVIQDAVDAAAEGDIIKVATGVYTGINAYGGLAQVVYLDKTVTLRGGYSPDFSAWDPAAYPTTLDAEGKGRVLYITGEPSGQPISPTVESLRITGGDATGLGGTFSGDDAGAGLYAITATLSLSDSEVFANNIPSSLYGYGAGLFIEHGQATLVGNTIRENQLGAMFGSGGGLYVSGIDPLILRDNLFRMNWATIDAGISVYGSRVTLTGNTIESNTTWSGSVGGLALYACSGDLSRNIIRQNSAPRIGGLLLVRSDLSVTNNVIADNTASADVSGMSVSDSSVRFLHNTLARNTGGVAVKVTGAAEITLTNTILVSHTVGVTVTAGSTATLEATLWNDNGTDWGGAGKISTGAINLWGDPDFVAPYLGNYHISAASAALDAGIDAGVYEDIDGEVRPRDAGFDLGADEGPTLPGTTVTTSADSGPGSLRQALLDAVSGDTITFDPSVFPPGSPATIALTSGPLPDITQGGLTIDASSAGVILDGSALTNGDGLQITSDGNVIQGLQILYFPGNGIAVDNGASDNLIGGSLGTSGNLVSGNTAAGISIVGAGAENNRITGNMVGLTADGTSGLGNGRYGVLVFHQAAYNVVGGSTPDERNVVSDNAWEGIRIHRASYNTVAGNYVGTNASGTLALGNGQRGILVWDADYNTIGGTTPGEGNLVSGNGGEGIAIWGFEGLASFPDISGLSPEYSGVFPTISFPDSEDAFTSVDNITPQTTLGEGFYDLFAARFTGQLQISMAGEYEFSLGSDDGSLLYIDGNLVIDRNFETGFGYNHATRYLEAGSHPIEIDFFESYGSAGLSFETNGPAPVILTTGGGTPGLLGEFFLVEEEIIASEGNIIVGNSIGIASNGTSPLANRGSGVVLYHTGSNEVGGSSPGERNIITYNRGNGISIQGTGSDDNLIQNNWIGIDADSTGGLDPRDLVVTKDGTLFLADYGRGVVRSTDGAGSWQEVSHGLGTLKVDVVAVSPEYASDGRVWAWGDGALYGSDDGGVNWSAFSETLPDDVVDLAVSPNYGVDGTLLAAVATQGFYRSTDGGLTWTQVYENWYADCVAFSPNVASDGVVLAGLSWGGVLRSTDSGAMWGASNTGLTNSGVYDLAFAADGLTVLAVSDNCSNDGVYRSTDGGQTWIASGTGLEDCGSEWQVAVSPSFASDGVALALEDGVYRSTDGGLTWSRTNEGAYGSRGHALAFSPSFASDQNAYLANFAGVYRSTDGGQTWDWAGANLADWGNHGRGVEICCGAGATQVLDNVIGRNAWQGISLWDPEGAGTVIDGNLIGLAPDGVTRAGNGSTGIWLSTPHVTVNDNTVAAGGHGGIRSDTRAHHLTITGNRIGTDRSGMLAVGNSYDGISLESSWDIVRDNLVSGNWGTGINASESVTSSLFAGNIVGLDASGTRGLVGGLPTVATRSLLPADPSLLRAVAANSELGNTSQGIYLRGSYNTIGGIAPADRNVISGNEGWGLGIAAGHDNVVVGNYIGTDTTGLNAVGNRGYGLVVYSGAHHNTIGGDTTAEGNVISANDQDGILFWDAHYNTVRGNYIGTDSTGTGLMGNAWSGIRLGSTDSSTNLIGDGNLVAGNGRAGVLIAGGNSLHNVLTQNSIYANAWLGIELRYGGNTELPAPVITAYDLAAGTASGTACPGCTVELFSDEAAEGRWFEGSTVTDGNGDWTLSKGSSFHGPELTTTATDASGNTSEFGQDWPADPPPPPYIAAPLCGVTNQSQPTFSGNAQMGSTVQLGTGGLDLGQAVTNDQNRWDVISAESLADGTYVITSTATTVWGTSGKSTLNLSVDSGLWYDPVGVTFSQLGVTQHPRDAADCVDPGAPEPLSLSLWPDQPVTVQVPVGVPGATVYVQVNSISHPLSDPDGDGVFIGSFDPGSSGNIVIVLVVEVGSDQQTMQIGSTIDPDGYVYDAELTASTGITQTVAGATVTLEVLDTVRSRWLQWDAELYGQVNPQVTGIDGYFAFFTPPGQYRLVVDGHTQGYGLFVSPVLTVVDEPIRFNVPLVRSRKVFLPLVIRGY